MIDQSLALYALLFTFTVIGAIVANKFKMPLVIGFLAVGAMIGPSGFNLIKDVHLMETLIEFGAILLLFSVGIEFSVKKLFDLGGSVFIAGIFQMATTFFLAFIGSNLLGLGTVTSIFVGVILSFSSTVIIVKILEQKQMFKRSEVPFLLGVLIIEDVIAVFVLTILSSAANPSSGGMIADLENVVMSMGILIFVYLAVSKFADRLLEIIEENFPEELILFIGLALCMGFATLASVLGLSPTIGAFLAGSTISSMKNPKKLGESVVPQNILLSSLFFIAMGTLVDFKSAAQNIVLILLLLLLFIVIIFIAVTTSTFMFAGMRKEHPVFSGIAMLSVGEFSLLVAQEAKSFGIAIDLVTITTCLIMLSSILMAFIVKYNTQIYYFLDTIFPEFIKKNMMHLGNYIGTFLQHMSIENTHTKDFKRWILNTLKFVSLLIFVIICTHKLCVFLFLINQQVYAYISLALALALGGFFVHNIILSARNVHDSGTKIMSYMRGDMNIGRADMILRNLSIGFVIMILGMLSPIVIVAMGFLPIFSLVSIAIVISGIVVMSGTIKSIKNAH